MRFIRPRKAHWVALALILVLYVGRWMIENYFSSAIDWRDFPVFWLTIVALAFWAGIWLDDLQNKDSWIWHNIRWWRRVFAIESVLCVHQNNASQEWLEVRVKIKFLKVANNVHLVLRVKNNLNLLNHQNDFVLERLNYPRVERDQQETVTVAAIPLNSLDGSPRGYQSWGGRLRLSGDVDGMRSLPDGVENILEICAKAFWRAQTEQIFIATLHRNSHEFGRVFIRKMPFVAEEPSV